MLMTTYEIHPFAEVWPPVEGADFDKMLEDIQLNGLRLPIILLGGKVLDGRTRLRICEKLGLEPKTITYTGTEDQARALVRSLNEHRRHLTPAQRHDSTAKIVAANPGVSARFLGDKANVSPQTITAIRQEITTAQTEQSEETKKTIKTRDGRTVTVLSAEAREKRDAEIMEHRGIGMTIPKIARRMKLSNSTVYDAIQRNKAAPTRRAKPKGPVRPVFERRSLANVPALTREQVDPEFTGTPMEFVDKYGHVQMQTAEVRAQSRFTDWAIVIGFLAKKFKEQPKLPDVDIGWLRSARPADVERMKAALDVLLPVLLQAKALLNQAKGTEQ